MYYFAPWRQEQEGPIEQRSFEDALTELQAIGRAVLLGDPGSGKTTTFYKLAADLIDKALLDRSAPVPLMIRLGLWTDATESFPAFLRRSVGELADGFDQRLAAGRASLLLDGLNELPSDQQANKYRQVGDFLARIVDRTRPASRFNKLVGLEIEMQQATFYVPVVQVFREP